MVNKQFLLKLTPEQYEALQTETNISAYIRRLIAEDFARQGKTFPDNMPERPALDKVRHKRWER